MRSTRTFALMEVSPATFDEVLGKLKAAGYDDAVMEKGLDMNGIALSRGADSRAAEAPKVTVGERFTTGC